jgi:myosin heavy subunit
MLLVAGPAYEFLKFIEVLCWTILPVLALAVLVTVLLHYRKKRRNNGKEDTGDGFTEALSGQVGYTNGNGEYVSFDHSDLIQQYKDRLAYNHARYAALQHDFTAIETKYAGLAKFAQTYFITHKRHDMENLQEQMPKHLQADINGLAEDQATEKKELMARLEQAEKSYRRIEQENRLLQDQINMDTATDEEKAAIVSRWREENILLRDKVADQEYLADIVEEKRAQVNFLQSQLEQRIKNLYQSEHQRLKTVAELKQLKESIEPLENELLLKREQADKIQVVICEKEEQLAEKQQMLTAKLDHITYLENMLRETKEQNELFNASLADSRDVANALQQQLSDEQSKVQFLTQKVFANKQTMRRLYKEFSAFVDDGSEESPVIPLRPEYSNRENGETAIQ